LDNAQISQNKIFIQHAVWYRICKCGGFGAGHRAISGKMRKTLYRERSPKIARAHTIAMAQSIAPGNDVIRNQPRISPARESRQMSRGVSIMIGLIIVAACVAYTFRWEIATTSAANGAIYRLNRWNGAITWCVPRTAPPSNLDCEAK
jgi:hypothetical protein